MDCPTKSFNLAHIFKLLFCGFVFFVPFVIIPLTGRYPSFYVQGIAILDASWAQILFFIFISLVTSLVVGACVYYIGKYALGCITQMILTWSSGSAIEIAPYIALTGMLCSAFVIAIAYQFHILSIMLIVISMLITLMAARFSKDNCGDVEQKLMRVRLRIKYLRTSMTAATVITVIGFVKYSTNKTNAATESLLLIIIMCIALLIACMIYIKRAKKKITNETQESSCNSVYNQIVEDTRNTWSAEQLALQSLNGEKAINRDSIEILEISKRLSSAVEFIHLNQSIAIAWILGSCLAKHVLPGSYFIESMYLVGIALAVWLLFFGFFREWHQSLHTRYMLDKLQGTPAEKY